MGLKTLAEQTQQVINANQNKQFGEVKKPEEPSLIERVLPWFGGKKEQQ
ncbi:lipoprotein [Haemophilus pittmaniae]|nr:lipoprotein [Haemophilus pittmaniae]